HEVLMRDTHGNVACGSMSNLFLWQGDELLTPADEQCGVAGVMRSLLLEAAPKLGLRVRYMSLTVAQLAAARAIILSNVRLGAQPVHWYEGRRLEVDPRLTQLQELIDGAAA
ncbi:MAG: aminotransferase class IV, partial [Proteobacteria bacterium]|nr:aminotransferase class IV [Pseudomonadota bacterium]